MAGARGVSPGTKQVDGLANDGKPSGMRFGILGQETSKNAPPPPDYQGAAQRQQAGSSLNTNGPFGGVSTTIDPVTGQPTINTTLSGPLAQAAGNAQNQAATQGALPTGMEARQQAFNSYMDQAQSRLDPMFERQDEALRTRLMNQGLDPNSAAAAGATQQFQQGRNDAYSSALNNAALQSTAAGESIFNQGVQSQQMPYQQMAMIQALTNPQFGAASGMYQSPQALAAAIAQGNYQMAGWQNDYQNTADTIGGASDLLGALIKMGG